MDKKLIQIDFDEALKRTRNDERVYAFDLSQENKVTVYLFNRLDIGRVLSREYFFAVVE